MPDCPICGERVGAKAKRCRSCETELRDEFGDSLFDEEEAPAKTAAATPLIQTLVNGRPVGPDGPYSGLMAVVGESHYQPALRSLFAAHADGRCRVCIEAEPANAYDAHAVRVCAEHGEGLGYLRREVAAEYQPFLLSTGRVHVEAELRGGASTESIGIVLQWDPVRDLKRAWKKSSQ